ncbi:hypothetical protein RHMOL_Rhmol12G0082600 [Rhododendron molle]|uniref:Uncharacterized protein n=1 Tax=Rhododendron molle TaxID=49168 RepID=A0ACC0LFX9_RHOML|nr:hypothetical protein RHMOL_Rhmol12G0082600 [Rhododendron molle]
MPQFDSYFVSLREGIDLRSYFRPDNQTTTSASPVSSSSSHFTALSPIIRDEGCGIWLGKKSAAKLWEEKAYQGIRWKSGRLRWKSVVELEDPMNIEDGKVDVSFGVVKHKQALKSEEKSFATTALSDTADGGRGSDKQMYLMFRVGFYTQPSMGGIVGEDACLIAVFSPATSPGDVALSSGISVSLLGRLGCRLCFWTAL